MFPNQRDSRIDTLELKYMLIKKIGHHRAEKYFDMIRRLFILKISKSEFNKFCIRTIGRENVHLHNRLIRSIIKNACLAKVPPLKGIGKAGINAKVSNGYQKSCLQSLCGDAFPQSPCKGRSPVKRDCKFRARSSPLVPNRKPQNIPYGELISKAPEQESPTELLSLDSRPPIEVTSVEDGEEVEQDAGSPTIQSRSPVTAPLGISIHLGGARKALPNVSIRSTFHPETCQNCGELPDTKSLRSRLEQKLEIEGLGVSVDCVNLLNNGLDAYLKRLLEPCIRLAATRHGNDHLNQLNGLYIGGSNGTLHGRHVHGETKSTYASMLDFRAAVELNPKILGEDWATQFEKIALHAYEE